MVWPSVHRRRPRNRYRTSMRPGGSSALPIFVHPERSRKKKKTKNNETQSTSIRLGRPFIIITSGAWDSCITSFYLLEKGLTTKKKMKTSTKVVRNRIRHATTVRIRGDQNVCFVTGQIRDKLFLPSDRRFLEKDKEDIR